jgi:nucleotide-binding universal stress UspA family protein
MKLFIAFDGSECSDVALDDLHLAGLPEDVDARIFTVAEEVLAEALYPVEALSTPMAWYPLRQPDPQPAPAKQIEQTREIANGAANRLRRDFPAWRVGAETACGSPAALIGEQIRTWEPDLVVMGCHGRHGFSRLMLGSVSQHVLNHSQCAVRIARPPARERSGPIRLLIGVDASADAAQTVSAIARRAWPAGTQARVIGVIDAGIPLTIRCPSSDSSSATHTYEEFRSWIGHTIRDAADDLHRAGLVASHQVLTGDPASVLMKEATDWNADCIVVGARGIGTLHRLILGSVSSEVAAHAECSVEVIRRPAGC